MNSSSTENQSPAPISNKTDPMTEQKKLSLYLREITQPAHSKTEGESFINKIFTGKVTNQEYYLYTWALHQFYTTLETELEKNKNHPAVLLVNFQELLRSESLSMDLKYWSQFKVSIPTQLQNTITELQNHIKKISTENPILLVAHSYVRYLGDLSGGQMIARVLKKNFTSHDGLNFYNFEQVQDIEEMKKAYRKGLDQIGEKFPDHIQILGEEAILAFKLNSDIFSTLMKI